MSCRSPLLAATLLAAVSLPSIALSAPQRDDLQTVQSGSFILGLNKQDGTARSLVVRNAPEQNYLPLRIEGRRRGDGFVHLGDIDFRLKSGDAAEWSDFSSWHLHRPVKTLKASGETLEAADITSSMGAGFPLRVIRRWITSDGGITLAFDVSNPGKTPVTIGGLGIPMVFGNDFTDETLDQAHAHEVFVDPAIARDGGYIRVTRMSGHGQVLLGMPLGATPLEAWRTIAFRRLGSPDVLSDATPRGQTFEGFYDWTPFSAGFAEREWKSAGPQWNEPTQLVLKPGESRRLGVRFVSTDDVRHIDDALIRAGQPVAMGVPGYVVPQDSPATLFLHAPSPIISIASEPAGALTAQADGDVDGWKRYKIGGANWGRSRLLVTYADGRVQTINYFVTKPTRDVAKDLGHFLFTRQWYEAANDKFNRSPGIMGYDREANAIITQEPRVWIAGMSDEGGAGSFVAAAMKELDNPVPDEVAKLEKFADTTVVGHLQKADGPAAGGVRKSLFYYDPKAFPDFYDSRYNWTSWTSWPLKEAADLGRAYNYPHVAIVHWVLYRLARDHQGLTHQHDWNWYLDHAALTATAMMEQAPYYTQFGLMEGEVFVEILKDLRREGRTEQADRIEALMHKREAVWKSLRYPFGSEMAWDSTGQPEVYAWLTYFGDNKKADVTRDAILAYDPTLPSWGYNGNARRYWDFLYGGKVARIERQVHHYGSALNAVPLFTAYRKAPEDFYMLRVAYGGMMGALTNIDRDGFGSAAFHSDPDMMRFDAYSGDYGMGYFGHALASQTDILQHPRFGWLAFGGALHTTGPDTVDVVPHDSARTRIFLAPEHLWLTLDSGHFSEIQYDRAHGKITLSFEPGTAWTPTARLRIEQASASAPDWHPESARPVDRGAVSISLKGSRPVITLIRE